MGADELPAIPTGDNVTISVNGGITSRVDQGRVSESNLVHGGPSPFLGMLR